MPVLFTARFCLLDCPRSAACPCSAYQHRTLILACAYLRALPPATLWDSVVLPYLHGWIDTRARLPYTFAPCWLPHTCRLVPNMRRPPRYCRPFATLLPFSSRLLYTGHAGLRSPRNASPDSPDATLISRLWTIYPVYRTSTVSSCTLPVPYLASLRTAPLPLPCWLLRYPGST